MNLSAWSIRYPRLLGAMIATVTVWGLVSLFTLPRQEDPAITWRLANVITRLPGASPKRVESRITDVVERHVRQVDEVEHVYSVSRAGLSLVEIELADEVKTAPPVWQKVRQKLAEAALELPPGVSGPELDDEIMGTFTVLVAITGKSQSYRQLKDHAQRLENKLRFLPEAASTSLFGTQPERIEVEPDPARLAANGLSLTDVAERLVRRNARQPSGRLRVGQGELLVEASGEFENERQIADMLLHTTADGRTLRLADVAHVRRTTQQPPEPLARFQGQKAVMVGARARTGVRIDEFGSTALRLVDEFRTTLPPGVECHVVHDLGRYTRDRESQLSQTMLWSIIGVFLSTAIFMNLRSCTIIAAAMPLTALVVLICFSLLGVPLDQMSVMGMIMSMGLLVDNAILVTEQIDRRMADGVSVEVAAAEEPYRLLAPLVVSTLTTVAAFVPIYLLSGGVGEFVRAIPISLGVSLLLSLLVAVTVTPWLYTRLASRSPEQRGPVVPGAGKLYDSLEGLFARLLERVVVRPGLTVGLAIVAVVALGSLGLTLRRDFFSPVQREEFVIDVYAPQGSALAHTLELVERVETIARKHEGVTSVVSFVGRNTPLVFYNLVSQETYATHFAQLIVSTKHWSATPHVAAQVQTTLDEQLAGAECCVHILEHGAPLVAPFEVRISGPDLATLDELGRRAGNILAGTPGVRNIRSNYGTEALKLVAEVNEPVARSIGLDQTTVADELRFRLDGLPAGFVQEDDERIDIAVRLPPVDRRDMSDLERMYFKPTPNSSLIPFSTVAALRPTWETASIYRRDGQRTLTVLAYPDFGRTAAEVSKGFIAPLDELASKLPAGYSLALGGENEQRREAESNLLGGSVYAFWIIVLLIMAEFRSLRLTGLVAGVIVCSMAGAMLALWLTGWPLNFMAMMGMAMHAGVAENDAVVLLDGLERRRRAGEPLAQLVVEGTRERTRHVLITSTSIGGYVPLAFSSSLLWPPMAIVMIGGLILSTLLTLIVVPAGYMLLRR